MKKAFLQFGSAKYITIFIKLILSSVLSRILSPEDFGIVAVIMVFCIFFNTFSTMGIGTGIIQNKNMSFKEVEGVFSFSVWISVFLWLIFWLLAYPVSWFYGDKIYVSVMQYLSVSVFLSSLNVVPNALMLKEEKFNIISVRMIVSAVISGLVAVIVALKGGKYYALVIQDIIMSGIQFFWNILNLKLHFNIKPKLSGLKKIGKYSFFQFLYSVILSLSQNLDNLLVGKYIGKKQLAYYNKSYGIMRYPIDYIPHTISPILHPILSKYQDDKTYIYKQYVQMIKMISGLGILCSFIFIWEADEIILILFGSQWKESVEIFRIFGFSMWFQIVNALAGSIYQSANATKNMFFSGMIHISFSIIAIFIGVLYKSASVLALALTISWVFKFIIESIFLVKKSLHVSLKCYWKLFVPELFIFLIASVVFYFVFPINYFSFIVNLIMKNVVIILVFLVLYMAFGQHKYFLKFSKRNWNENR